MFVFVFVFVFVFFWGGGAPILDLCLGEKMQCFEFMAQLFLFNEPLWGL